jgi:hypothetical protein
MLDANLTAIGRGNAADFPAMVRDKTHFLHFTLSIHPRMTNPRVLDIDPQEFPNQQATISTSSVSTMCVAQRHNDEAGADEEGKIPTRR